MDFGPNSTSIDFGQNSTPKLAHEGKTVQDHIRRERPKASPHQTPGIAKCSVTEQAFPNMTDAEVAKEGNKAVGQEYKRGYLVLWELTILKERVKGSKLFRCCSTKVIDLTIDSHNQVLFITPYGLHFYPYFFYFICLDM